MQELKLYKVFKVFNIIFLLFVVFIIFYLFLNVVVQFFSSEFYINLGKVSIILCGFNVEIYKIILCDSMFWINYKNMVIYIVVGMLIFMFMIIIFVYVILKRRLMGCKFWIMFVVFIMFFSGGLILNYVLINFFGMNNMMWVLVVFGVISIYNMLIMKLFFENMFEELEEVVVIDGLNIYGILFCIILLLSKVVMVIMVLFYVVGYWNLWFLVFFYFDKKELFFVIIYLWNMIVGVIGGVFVGVLVDNLI